MNLVLSRIIISAMILILSGTIQWSRATHLMGAELVYSCLGNNKYLVTVKVYRDCNGIQVSQSNLVVRDGNNNSIQVSSQTKLYVRDITFESLCSPASRCANGSFQYGIEEHAWQMTVDVDTFSACELTLSWEQNARNSSITTGSANQNFFTTATLNKCLSNCNSSPVFSKSPTPILLVCHNQDALINYGIVDSVDHDSLSFELVNALQGLNNSVTYSGNFTPERPLAFFGFPNQNLAWPAGFHMDPLSGEITFRPTQVNQVAVVVVEVSEWRNINGTMQVIGKTRRDMQVIVIPCPNNNPPDINPPYAKMVCAGNQVCVDITTGDDNTDDTVQISWNAEIPGATFTNNNGQAQFASGQVCWTPPPGAEVNSPYSFKIIAKDDNCPRAATTIRAFSIFVRHKDSVVDGVINIDTGDCGWVKIDHTPGGNYGNYSYKLRILDSSFTEIRASVNQADSAYLPRGKYYVELSQGATNYCGNVELDSFVVKHRILDDDREISACEGNEILIQPDTLIVGVRSYDWYEEMPDSSWVSRGSFVLKKFIPTHSGRYVGLLNFQECSVYDTTRIYLNALPKSSIVSSHDSVCLDHPTILFTANDSLSPVPITSHYWSFGDGGITQSIQANHTFNQADTFLVTLFVGSDSACWDSTKKTIWVFPGLRMDTVKDQWAVKGASATFRIGQAQAFAGYQWQADTGQGFVDLVNNARYSGVNSASMTISNLQLKDSTYRFRCLVNLMNCSDISNEAGLTITNGTGVGNIGDGGIQLYPNPASTVLIVQYPDWKESQKVIIVNSAGQLVYSGTLESATQQIDIVDLPKGVYVLQMEGFPGGLRFVKE